MDVVVSVYIGVSLTEAWMCTLVSVSKGLISKAAPPILCRLPLVCQDVVTAVMRILRPWMLTMPQSPSKGAVADSEQQSLASDVTAILMFVSSRASVEASVSLLGLLQELLEVGTHTGVVGVGQGRRMCRCVFGYISLRT